MKIKLLLPILALLISANLNAQISDGLDPVSNFLVVSTEQQKIAVNRYLNANRDIANQCMAGWDLDKSTDYFVNWINDHPQYLRRTLTTTLSAGLLDACKSK